MVRRSTRSSLATASPTTAATPQKANSSASKTASAGTKRSRATPVKSQHFSSPRSGRNGSSGKGKQPQTASAKRSRVSDNHDTSEDELSPSKSGRSNRMIQDDEEEPSSSSSDEDDDDASEFGEDSKAEPEASESDEEGDEEDLDSDDEESDRPAKRRKTNGKVTPASSKSTKGKELWRTDVKTGLGPGNAVVIKRPKARAPGKTPYETHTIHPNTYLFLQDLADNNDREWLKMHDPDYRKSWSDFTEWAECLQEKIIAEADDTIPELPIKDVFFRIYRDIRFSPDPTPYKAHFSAAWSRTGRKGPFAGYYVQLKPGNSFVGAGLWMPEASAIAKLRRDIHRKSHKIKAVLKNAGIRKSFFKGVAADDKKTVKAFCSQNTENALKTKPKGFEADNPNIELLRLRNFTIGSKVPDQDIIGEQSLDNVLSLIKALVPFVTYLNSIVMPDGPEEDDSDSSEADEEDEAEEGPGGDA